MATDVTDAAELERSSESTMREILHDLIRQRHAIERTTGDRDLLEANRLGIAYWEGRLSRLLAEGRGQRKTPR
ncbi:MAG TPA: hypothetical protein VIL77_16600 [Gaiellaceae bacterium]